MDRFASNTLRTLAIVAISIVVIVGSLALLLLALCFGLVGNLTSGGHHDPQVVKMFFGAILAAIALVTVGILAVAKLAKGIVRESAILSAQPPAQSNSSTLPSPPSPPDAHPLHAQPLVPPGVSRDVVTHFSPVSRTVIHRLALAITAQIASQVVPVILGWRWILRSAPTASRPALLTALLSVFATNVPYLVLLFSLLRRPGRRTFAYALAIPSILILFGVFGNSAIIFFLLRGTHSAASLLLTIPWALHVLILYLSWKAIRLTGILPNPARIIAAAVVVFFYYTVIPVLVLIPNYFHH